MRKRGSCFTWVLAACLCALMAAPAHAFDDATADRVLQFAEQQLNRTATALGSRTDLSPTASTTSLDGTWKFEESTDRIGWTQGFYPGLLWFMYEQSGRDPFWRGKAEPWTTALEAQKSHPDVAMLTHDLGFKFMTSYGNAYRVTGNDAFRQTLVTAAESLSRRFRPPGIIDCCDWPETPPWRNSLVTDTMMNLELLFWASRNGGSATLRERALSHALRTMTDMVREDGGTYHVVDYDESGRFIRNRTYQGFSTESTWARGQAWAIYGFTMAYRYTRDARMLETAQRTANYYLDRVPENFIPNWDFHPDAPEQEDTSAAAIVASALLELSTFVPDPAVAQRYRNAALATLDTLSSPDYLAQGTASPGILLHGVGFHPNVQKPGGSDVDRALIYSDYYFIEAVLRFKRQAPDSWFATLGFSESVHELGTGNTGVVDVEFDVTPFSNSVDGVVGYADSSTTITGYADLPMTIRMNPAGFFDVRRGGAFAALVSLPYQAYNTYHVRMRADLNARTYSVWVTPPGGSEVMLADRFAFRTGAPLIDDLGKVSLRTVRFEYDFRVNNHVVRSGEQLVWLSTTDFSRSVHELGTGNTGIQETVFNVTPARSPIDTVVGYADSSTTVTGYADLAMTIRFNPAGFIDVRRGGSFAALVSLPYQANATYRVRMRTNLNTKVYSVWVTPPGGSEVMLADRFAFRTGAPLTDDLGKVSLRSIGADGDIRVVGHTVRAVSSLGGVESGAGSPGLSTPEALGSIIAEEENLRGCAAAPGSALAAAGVLLAWLTGVRRRRRQE